MASIITGLILAAIIFLVLIKFIRDKKKGRASCSCGCDNCAMKGTCHNTETDE